MDHAFSDSVRVDITESSPQPVSRSTADDSPLAEEDSFSYRAARTFLRKYRHGIIAMDFAVVQNDKSQEGEALIACNLLNRMTELDRPESFEICP